jgi:hypothetical protein
MGFMMQLFSSASIFSGLLLAALPLGGLAAKAEQPIATPPLESVSPSSDLELAQTAQPQTPQPQTPQPQPAAQASTAKRPKKARWAEFLVNVDQATAWSPNRSGISNTWLNVGLTGNLGKDKLFTWSVTGGPTFQWTSIPNRNATDWRFDVYTSLSPLKGDEVNIFANLRTIGGANTGGPLRSLSAGVIASLSKSEIFPDVFESVNLPERGLYVRAQNRSSWSGDGTYASSFTDLYLGWSESWYPFLFSIETGPQLAQTLITRTGDYTPLRTNLGASFNVRYLIGKKSQAFIEYRPATSFGNQYGSNQLLRAGIGTKF